MKTRIQQSLHIDLDNERMRHLWPELLPSDAFMNRIKQICYYVERLHVAGARDLEYLVQGVRYLVPTAMAPALVALMPKDSRVSTKRQSENLMTARIILKFS